MDNENMNQCQGCQAGWEIVSKALFKGWQPMDFHIVKDGYEGEIASCTKHMYPVSINDHPQKDKLKDALNSGEIVAS